MWVKCTHLYINIIHCNLFMCAVKHIVGRRGGMWGVREFLPIYKKWQVCVYFAAYFKKRNKIGFQFYGIINTQNASDMFCKLLPDSWHWQAFAHFVGKVSAHFMCLDYFSTNLAQHTNDTSRYIIYSSDSDSEPVTHIVYTHPFNYPCCLYNILHPPSPAFFLLHLLTPSALHFWSFFQSPKQR